MDDKKFLLTARLCGNWSFFMFFFHLRSVLVVQTQINLVLAGNEIWPDDLNRPNEIPTIDSFEVMCGKEHMDIQIRFTGPFNGVVSSKGVSLRFSVVQCVSLISRNFHLVLYVIIVCRSYEWSELLVCSTIIGRVILYISNTVHAVRNQTRLTRTILWEYGVYCIVCAI